MRRGPGSRSRRRLARWIACSADLTTFTRRSAVTPTSIAWLSANPVPEVSPNASALPGGAALQTLLDGLAFYTLAIAVAVLIGGAAAWALGSNTGNLEWATNGKRATVVAACP